MWKGDELDVLDSQPRQPFKRLWCWVTTEWSEVDWFCMFSWWLYWLYLQSLSLGLFSAFCFKNLLILCVIGSVDDWESNQLNFVPSSLGTAFTRILLRFLSPEPSLASASSIQWSGHLSSRRPSGNVNRSIDWLGSWGVSFHDLSLWCDGSRYLLDLDLCNYCRSILTFSASLVTKPSRIHCSLLPSCPPIAFAPNFIRRPEWPID